jgi:hypothetical protein
MARVKLEISEDNRSKLLGWISGDNSYYRKLAQGCLEIIGSRQLTGKGADLDKVNPLYLQQIGSDDETHLPPDHVVDMQALEKALLLAHNDKNGSSATSVKDILR